MIIDNIEKKCFFKKINLPQLITIMILLFSFTYCDIIIRNPEIIKNKFEKGIIKTGYATFGYNPYGYTLTGRVYYDPNNKDTDLACNYEKMKDIITDKSNFVDSVPIVMLDRGSCHFVDKARNVQKAGGKVALIVNSDEKEIDNIIMADDGTASDIMIPLILISNKDGKILKDYYYDNKNNADVLKNFVLDVDFQIEHNSNTVKVQIFMNSESEEIYKLMLDMYKFKDLSKLLFYNYLLTSESCESICLLYYFQ